MKLFSCVSLFVLSHTFQHVSALPTLAEKVDFNAPVPLDAFKKSSNLGGRTAEFGGHNIPIEHWATLIKDSLAEGMAEAKRPRKRSTFDAAAQLIDVHGDHEFIMPNFTAGDVRGPCPGLNTLSNHNYLPRNGIASITQYIEATQKVWGMGNDISTILAVYGTLLGGNILSLDPGVSIGGMSSTANPEQLLDNLGGLLGKPRGLSGTHNSFEVDGSNTRNDRYDPIGNVDNVNMTYFGRLFDKQKDAEVPNYTLDVMFEYAIERWYQDIAYNPYFIYLPWSGWFVRNAAIIFSGELFGNHSAEHPDGIFGKEALKMIYGVSGPDDNMVYTPGSDRIPENYYKRPQDFLFMDGAKDLVTQTIIKHPQLFSIGGNTNGVNTFAGLDFADITGGVFNAANLLEGNNALCFAFQFVKEASPNMLSTLYATLGPVLSALTDALDTVFTSLDCPAYKDLSVNGTDLFSYFNATYPGAQLTNGAM
ncbi:Aromatic peroxygenase [Lachnellula occidentalis]|uniref:Aromatic peroxygenase n=1 Tax=Lachnellula occidentalis TaxID=215460 RepID=A0A8H8UE23_9HELO|nr:Aromatic peroxygenase [Lachnellula occidentalis]